MVVKWGQRGFFKVGRKKRISQRKKAGKDEKERKPLKERKKGISCREKMSQG